jgi:hypothetical protein
MKKTNNTNFIISAFMLIFSISNNMLFAKKNISKSGFHSISNTDNIKNSEISHSIYSRGLLNQAGLDEEIFNMAFNGFGKINKKEIISSDSIITIIDFSKPSNEKRLFVIDLKSAKLIHQSVVAHGRNTGEKYARIFSNKLNSHMSSIGFYITKKTYMGENGYSLRLDGLERGFNDNAMKRSLVIHGADYADESVINSKGYLGRSYGCPALPREISKQVIEKIKDGNIIFAYYPDENYLKQSSILN